MAIMERMCFCCSLYFLGIMCIVKAYNHGTGGNPYSNVVSTEQKVLAMQPMSGAVRPWTENSEFMKNPPVMRPYHVFPMFQHVPVPLVDMDLFRPVSGRRHLPNLLTSLLIPQVNPQFAQVSPVRNARGVEVWCGYSKISVRMNENLLGFRSSPSLFHLGTCPVSRSDRNFLYFHYDLNDCDSSLTMMNGQIMYSNTVRYTPEPQGTVIRAVPLTLNIQCLYNRFHYSYKIGFLPVPREHMFHKIFERRAKFSISVCNERWERLEENVSFVLGEPMYFEVSAAHMSKDERIFVDSCYATASKDPKSIPQHNVICNYGCMEDSRRQESLSRFLQRQSNIIRFSVDAFLLPQVTGTHFYLHCTISVHDVTSASAKSCTYNNAERRWDELYTDASVCACCDSICEIEATSALPRTTQSLITSLPWIMDKNEQSLIKGKGLFGVQKDTEEVKFKSAEGIGEEEDDHYTVETVSDTEKQMKAKENKNMPMKDLDEDVEVIVGTEETTAIELKDEGDLSGKVMSLEEQMDGVVELEEDAGRLNSAEGISKEKEDGYTVETVTDTEKQIEAKEENKNMPMKSFDEIVKVIVGTEETTAIKGEERDRSGKVMSVGEQMVRVLELEEDAGRLKSTELLEDVNDDKGSSKSGLNELIDITGEELSKYKIKPEVFEKSMQVRTTVPSHMAMDEEVFLDAKQEPIEWNKDEH
ncbi:zona pellucida glycoprotein 3d tandem duplicate 1 [Rhinichthys klamathensis goyatoka]|uniref:zona pellucida glycoprotein 3d tandem duplicate 1 n=1 Tax=Rhinichthys klamathensis goyatoka TaxID=3034132 RepID=UPI0024B53BD5|nr:zona pellucida glycoprotein 3d tandem duplicate 1 [Rhinichthys klamathensis goyatoka]